MLVCSFIMSAPMGKYSLSFTVVSQAPPLMPMAEKVFYREIVCDASQKTCAGHPHSLINLNYLKY